VTSSLDHGSLRQNMSSRPFTNQENPNAKIDTNSATHRGVVTPRCPRLIQHERIHDDVDASQDNSESAHEVKPPTGPIRDPSQALTWDPPERCASLRIRRPQHRILPVVPRVVETQHSERTDQEPCRPSVNVGDHTHRILEFTLPDDSDERVIDFAARIRLGDNDSDNAAVQQIRQTIIDNCGEGQRRRATLRELLADALEHDTIPG
jgi:hypothetical protein